jgi:putative transposase
MSSANPLWGAPRIVSELRKIGIDVAKFTVEQYMVRRTRPASPTWRSFLKNHARDLVSVGFFVVPTIRFRLLFLFPSLSAADRSRVRFVLHPA